MKRKVFHFILILQTIIFLFACSSTLKDVKKWEDENDSQSLFNAYADRYKNEEVRNAAKEVFIRKGVSSIDFLSKKLESSYARDRTAACSLLVPIVYVARLLPRACLAAGQRGNGHD